MESHNLKPSIIIEANIPFIHGLLDRQANVTYLAPEEITPEAMANVDGLITRTRTKCDEALLANSPISIIATATIGTDHINLDYCRQRAITVANAPGCNAPAVAQYVMSAIALSIPPHKIPGLTLGVVGVGNVGKIVAQWAADAGMKVLLCDPFRAEAEGAEGFVDMTTIAKESDVITFHTPHTTTGPHPTHHLLNHEIVKQLSRRPLIINAARGPVADTAAMIDGVRAGLISGLAIDCWEGEPDIDRTLLSLSTIATPHIAGYSREGKIRATRMAVEAVATHFSLTPEPMTETAPHRLERPFSFELIEDASLKIASDTNNLKQSPLKFEQLRNTYAYRQEPR